jgi:hypothetical protein
MYYTARWEAAAGFNVAVVVSKVIYQPVDEILVYTFFCLRKT